MSAVAMTSANALLDITRGTEEPLRPLRIGVDAAGQHFAGGRNNCVVGAAEPVWRVSEGSPHRAMFDKTLAFPMTISAT